MNPVPFKFMENTPKRRGRPPKGRTPTPVETLPPPSETVAYQLKPEGGRVVTVKGIVAPRTVISRGIVSKVTGRPVKFTKTYSKPVPAAITKPEGDFAKDMAPKPRVQTPGTFHEVKSWLSRAPVRGT